MTPDFLGTLIQQGGLALLAVGEAIAVVHLWRRNRELTDEVVRMSGDTASAMTDGARTSEQMASALDRLRDAVLAFTRGNAP